MLATAMMLTPDQNHHLQWYLQSKWERLSLGLWLDYGSSRGILYSRILWDI